MSAKPRFCRARGMTKPKEGCLVLVYRIIWLQLEEIRYDRREEGNIANSCPVERDYGRNLAD